MRRVQVAVAVLLSCLPLASTVVAEESAARPALVTLQAALDIDTEGRVSAVTFVDDLKLPASIRDGAGQVARRWRFLPPTRDGKAVSGRTYASVEACLVAGAERLDFTFAYAGNGPASTFVPPRKPVAPVLPLATLAARGINEMYGTIVYVVSADGRATLEQATLDDPELQKSYGALWFRDQRNMLKLHRYRPELIDGVPTATRVERLSGGQWFRPEDRRRFDEILQARREQSDACHALRGKGDRIVASDSVFRRVEG
jgi:hypothetical protein